MSVEKKFDSEMLFVTEFLAGTPISNPQVFQPEKKSSNLNYGHEIVLCLSIVFPSSTFNLYLITFFCIQEKKIFVANKINCP